MNRHERHRSYLDADRLSWQDPDSILTGIGLKNGMTFIDVGCGYGFFSIPAAKIVGASGRVIGIDIDDEGLQSIRESAARGRLKNVGRYSARLRRSSPAGAVPTWSSSE